MKLILASASKGRKHLLNLLKIPYEIMLTDIDEEKIFGKTPLATIQLRAKAKGEKVVKKLSSYKAIKQSRDKLDSSIARSLDCLILSADTEVVINNQLIGKPKDFEDGKRILKLLSGKTHEVITAFYIVKLTLRSRTRSDPKTYKITNWKGFDRSLVTFKEITTDEIKRYLKLTDYTRYTGAYALLASPQDFVIKTEGSLSNIIGLPLEKIIPILRENHLLDFSIR